MPATNGVVTICEGKEDESYNERARNQNCSRLNHFRAAAVRETELGECFDEADVEVEAEVEVEEDEK